MSVHRFRDVFAGLVIALSMPALASAAPVQMNLVTKITLPGKGGHGDWVAFDPGANKVYVALHGSGVAVVDAATNKVTATVDPIKGPNGIAFDGSYVYAAAGDSNELVVISKSDWKIVNRVQTKGKTPDGVWVDSARGTVLVSSDDNNWVEVYTAGTSPQLKATYHLLPEKPKSGPDVGVLVAQKGALYMPVDSYVEAIGLANGKLQGHPMDTHVPLTKTGGTKNMVYDPKTNTLWVGTTAKKVLILNADTLRIIRSVPAHGGIDQVSMDPSLRLVYTFESSAKGFDVYALDGTKPVAYVNTGSGNTHTGDVDPKTHYVYVFMGDANVLAVYTPAGMH